VPRPRHSAAIITAPLDTTQTSVPQGEISATEQMLQGHISMTSRIVQRVLWVKCATFAVKLEKQQPMKHSSLVQHNMSMTPMPGIH